MCMVFICVEWVFVKIVHSLNQIKSNTYNYVINMFYTCNIPKLPHMYYKCDTTGHVAMAIHILFQQHCKINTNH